MLVMMTPSPSSSERTRVNFIFIPDKFRNPLIIAEGSSPPEHPEGPAAAAVSLSLLPG